MPVTPAAAGLMLVLSGGVIACGWCWLIAAARAAITRGWLPDGAAAAVTELLKPLGIPPRLPLVAWSPRRPVPWAIIDLVLLFGVWIAVKLVLETAVVQLGWLPRAAEIAKVSLAESKVFVWLANAESLAILAIGLPLVALRTGARQVDFGWSVQHLTSDLRTGFVGLVMLAPPVFLLQALLVSFWQPSEHPFIKSFMTTPDVGFFAALFVATAIVAPLYEELMFRVFVQGLLERASTHDGSLWELLWEPLRPVFSATNAEAMLSFNPQAESMAAAANSDAPGSGLGEPLNPRDVQEQPELRGPPSRGSIGISALVFALLHLNHGPDWVPLFLLAVGMGYLYQRTHRLVPSLVVHAGLNAVTMWLLWVGAFETQQ